MKFNKKEKILNISRKDFEKNIYKCTRSIIDDIVDNSCYSYFHSYSSITDNTIKYRDITLEFTKYSVPDINSMYVKITSIEGIKIDLMYREIELFEAINNFPVSDEEDLIWKSIWSNL